MLSRISIIKIVISAIMTIKNAIKNLYNQSSNQYNYDDLNIIWASQELYFTIFVFISYE